MQVERGANSGAKYAGDTRYRVLKTLNIERRTPNIEWGFPLSPEVSSSRPSPPFGEEKETKISGAL
jgi:hypothetical protein